MTVLEKTQQVLMLDDSGPTNVTFNNYDDDLGFSKSILKIDRDTWLEMDRPTTVTITIEPGDKLNVDKG